MDLIAKTLSSPETQRSSCLIVTIASSGKLDKEASQINKACGGLIQDLIKRGDISGSLASTLLIPSVPGIKADRLLLVGYGNSPDLAADQFVKLAKSTLKALVSAKVKDACLLPGKLSVAGKGTPWMASQLAMLGGSGNYRYSKTLSKPKAASSLKRMTLATKGSSAVKTAIAQGKAIALGMNVAKNLGDLPGNICTPSYLAKQARAMGRQYKSLTTSILEEKKMRELGMGSLLSVTAGTDQPAKLIVMEYRGAAKSQKPHALVGKGITFDTGGISLKPGAAMDEMKFDMCGAASVFGTVTTVAELGLPINLVAVVAAVENMPSGSATKPGDIVTSMSGQTIEVLNTDAEGRLVLCDALTYVERYKPQSVIDIATLTGACVVALGKHASAIYSNQDDFADELLDAGKQIGDRGWPMPLWDEYQPQLHSNFADMANIGGRYAGSITAACFLSRFTKKMRWAHMDIAGTAWHSGANKGATGRPVGLLSQYLINQSGNK